MNGSAGRRKAPGRPVTDLTRGFTRGVSVAVLAFLGITLTTSPYVETATPPPGAGPEVVGVPVGPGVLALPLTPPLRLRQVAVMSWPTVHSAAPTQVPTRALSAYLRATTVINLASPACQADWQLIAGVGQVASEHGRVGAQGPHRLNGRGVAVPRLLGAVMDGVADTDAGAYDGTRRTDRPVGPMQLLPANWSRAAVDADGDGRRNPQDIDDAALAVAVLLCARPDDLSKRGPRLAALRRLNTRPSFVRSVLRARRAYLTSPAVPQLSLSTVRLGTAAGASVTGPTPAPTAPTTAVADVKFPVTPAPATCSDPIPAPVPPAPTVVAAPAPIAPVVTDSTATEPAASEPASGPSPSPTTEPTPASEPPLDPTATATADPTATATADPTATPTATPIADPSATASVTASAEPTAIPGTDITASPTALPTTALPLLALRSYSWAVGCPGPTR